MMSISPRCDSCGEELREPGALVFSPPSGLLSVCAKYHLCSRCWSEHFVSFGGDGEWTIEHPFHCRLSGRLAECIYTKQMHRRNPNLQGRYPISFTEIGTILFGGRTDV